MASEIVRIWVRDPFDDPAAGPLGAREPEWPEQASREQAELRSATIRASLERFMRDTEEAIVEAYRHRDWAALDYPSWSDYVRGEFGIDRLKLPRDERARAATRFHLMGMSKRAIASALGVSRHTVDGDVAQTAPPETVQGADGKAYPTARASTPPQPSETDDGYVSPERRLAVAAELPESTREVEWPSVARPGGAVESATPAGPTGEAPADQSPRAAYGPWRKFAASSLAKARKELALVTGDYLEAGTVAERADEATIVELEKLAVELADFCREVRRLRAPSPSGRTPAQLATWRRAHHWSESADEDHSQVWIAAQRKGIEYHRPAEKNLTGCGRSMRTGVVKGIGLAEFHHDAKPCERCWPNGDEESKS